MKDKFKSYLKFATTKLIDEKIYANIEVELDELEMKAELEEYKNQIKDRKNGIKNIFISFDNNMELIEQEEQRRKKTKNNTKDFYIKNTLDRIIERKITEKLKKIYKVTAQSNNTNKNKELSQIIDRRLRLSALLQDFDKNITVIYNKDKKTNKFKERDDK